jgi:hypothetical protein
MGERYILMEVCAIMLPEDGLAETGETFSELNLGWDVPKPLFNRGGQDCGIISA